MSLSERAKKLGGLILFLLLAPRLASVVWPESHFPDPVTAVVHAAQDSNAAVAEPQAPAGSAEALAQQILNTDSIGYNDEETRNSFEQVARGEPATTTCPLAPVASVEVSPKLLRVILAISAQGIPLEFNALVDACHTESSFHYRGLGVDIINAHQVGEQLMTYVSNNRVALGVNELFFNPYRDLAVNDGELCHCVIPNHNDHIHIGVNP